MSLSVGMQFYLNRVMEQENIPTELEQTNAALEVESPIETEVQRAKRKRRETAFELGLFFVLGLLIGVTLKTEAVKKITMGFNDYLVSKPAQRYDIDALKKKIEQQYAQQQAAQQQIQAEPQQ